MLALFPDLLSFSFLTFALLRVAAAFAFLSAAYQLFSMRQEISRVQLPLIGHAPQWLVLVSAVIVFIVAALLGIGLYTQAAAIAGMIIALKYLWYARTHPEIVPFSQGTSTFLFVICLCLLVSGAGPFAFDLPL